MNRDYSWQKRAAQYGLSAGISTVKTLGSMGLGAGKTLSDTGVAAMTGFGNYANMRNAPSIGNAFHRQAARSADAWETSGLNAKANTMAGRVGQNMVAVSPFMRLGNAVGLTVRGTQMARAAQVARTTRKAPTRRVAPTQKAPTKRRTKLPTAQPPRRWTLDFIHNNKHTKFKNMSNDGVQDWTRHLDNKGVRYNQDVM